MGARACGLHAPKDCTCAACSIDILRRASPPAGADLEMAAWRRWVQLGERLRSSCTTCSSDGRSSMADVVSIDAASIAVDTPGTGSSSGRSSKQFNPLREAALRPGEGCAAEVAGAQTLGCNDMKAVAAVHACVAASASASASGTQSVSCQCTEFERQLEVTAVQAAC